MVKNYTAVLLFGIILSSPTFTQSAVPNRPAVATAESILARPMVLSWRYDSEETVNVTPATDGRLFYVPTASGGIMTLEANTGKLVWRESMGGEISADPLAYPTIVVVANEITGSASGTLSAKGAIRALSRESGVTLWMRTIPFPLKGAIVGTPNAIYGAGVDGKVYALRTNDGQPIWTSQLQSVFLARPIISEGCLYLGGEDGVLYAIDITSGAVLWRYRTHGAIRARPAISEGLLAAGSADGYVYVIDQKTGLLRWKARTGAAVESVTVSGSEIVAASLDNFAYGMTFSRGGRLWKRELGGRPLAEPLLESSLVMINPISGNSAIVIDTRDGKVVNRLLTGDDNNSGASPVIAGRTVMLTTRTGLLAFARSD